MLNLLKVNIRQFNEEEEDFSKYLSDDGGLDVESLINDYSPTEETEPEEPEEVEGDPSVSESTTGDTEPEEEQGEDHTEETTEEDETEKRTPDQAFAEMRRQVEQNEPLAKWVRDLAAQQGFQDPQELIDAFQEQKLAKEAEAQGVPVDVYKRLHDLEQQNRQKDEEVFATKFNQEVDATKHKHNLDDAQINDVLKYMGQNGYISQDGKTKISFEDAYILANKDSMIQQAEERGRNSYLKTKKKQQQESTPNVGTHAQDKDSTGLDYSEDAILKHLESLDIDI